MFFKITKEKIEKCEEKKNVKKLIQALYNKDDYIRVRVEAAYGQKLFLHVFKKAAEREKGKRDYKVWQDEYHPQIIYTDQVCRQKLEYMHNNPVVKGFVDTPEYWLYSSARNYILGDDSVLKGDPVRYIIILWG
ncbi:MAG: hypothetical protein ACE5NG_12620 [bacterium]